MRNRSMISLFGAWLVATALISILGCKPQNPSVVKSANGSNIYLNTPSQQCRECHEDVFESWSESDHFHANDLYKDEEWGEAFGKYKVYVREGQVSEFYKKDGKPVINTIGPDGKAHEYYPDMTLAYNPMVQFLVPFAGGRWQVTEMAWDVHRKEWFRVFDDESEVRRPEEWGHWTRRGMNWNAQCGICHTTHYSKNYDIETDAYTSFWKEQGISCLQCHGEMKEHLLNPEAPLVPQEQVGSDAYYQSCFSCHSRREDITGNFRIGDRFDDHFRIQLPVADRYYFPDGQNKDEVFVYGSFLQSRMYHMGVRCMDCHDPHSLKLKLPVEDNQLCMVCHRSPGVNGAISIDDPLAHSHHADGSTGNRCVECHMPERTYMARDPRRDHGFHTPDPILSRELGVPNACSRCHTEETQSWVIDAYQEWYGTSEKRAKERSKARVTQQAYDGDPAALNDILDLMDQSEASIWRAAYAQLALNISFDEPVLNRVLPYLHDESPMVRSAVVQSLSGIPGFEAEIRPLLKDHSRLVRLDAAWYLRNEIDAESTVWQELMHYMKYTADQPGGALRWSEYYAGKGDEAAAESWIDKVIEWDPTSRDALIAKGFMMNRFGNTEKAIQAFQEAHSRHPENLMPVYYQALIYAEQGNVESAFEAFEKVVHGDPSNDRAWYNLALLYNQQGKFEAALSYLDQAISVNPEAPDYPYAKATILYQNRRFEELIPLLDWMAETFHGYAPAQQLKRHVDSLILHRPEDAGHE